MQCENPQNCANGYCIIITEHIILKLDMQIDHKLPIQWYIWFWYISRIDKNITDWKVYYLFWDTL